MGLQRERVGGHQGLENRGWIEILNRLRQRALLGDDRPAIGFGDVEGESAGQRHAADAIGPLHRADHSLQRIEQFVEIFYRHESEHRDGIVLGRDNHPQRPLDVEPRQALPLRGEHQDRFHHARQRRVVDVGAQPGELLPQIDIAVARRHCHHALAGQSLASGRLRLRERLGGGRERQAAGGEQSQAHHQPAGQGKSGHGRRLQRRAD